MSNPTCAPETTPAGTMLVTRAAETECHIRACRRLIDILARNLTGKCRKEDGSAPGDGPKLPSDLTSQVKHHLDEASDEAQSLENVLRDLLREFNIMNEEIPGEEAGKH